MEKGDGNEDELTPSEELCWRTGLPVTRQVEEKMRRRLRADPWRGEYDEPA